jgi:hypothetical protein
MAVMRNVLEGRISRPHLPQEFREVLGGFIAYCWQVRLARSR